MGVWEEFISWEEKNNPEIEKVKEILRRQISNEPEVLINDLSEIESYNGRIGTLLAEANGYLDEAKSLNLPPRDYGTELDRRTELDRKIVPYRQVRDTLEALSDAIRQRLIAAESILSYMKVYNEHSRKETSNPF